VISKLLLITDGCRFCDSKQTDNNNKYITYVVGSHFSLGSTARPKVFVISRILADFSSLRDNSANPNISLIFSSHPYFFRLQIGVYFRSNTTVKVIAHMTSDICWICKTKQQKPSKKRHFDRSSSVEELAERYRLNHAIVVQAASQAVLSAKRCACKPLAYETQ